MFYLIKKYWREFAVLISACAYFLYLAAPNITSVNVDVDSLHYLSGAMNFVVTPPQGAPLYNIINALIARIPITNPFSMICASTAIFSGLTAMVLFIWAKRYTKSKWIALLAPLCFCASAVVVSQATILKQYSLITLLSVLALYLHFSGRDKAKYIVLALGVAVHHLIIFALLVVWLWDMVKHKKAHTKILTWSMGIPLIGLLFYIWVPLTNRPPWIFITGYRFKDYVTYLSKDSGLIGGLGIFTWNGLQRLQDGISILGYSFGACWILIVYALFKFRKNKKDIETGVLVFMWALPLLYYLTDRDPTTFTYTMMAFAFGGLLVVKGAEWLRENKNRALRYGLPILTGVCCMGFIIANSFFFNVGKNIDVDQPDLNYYNSLSNIQNDSFVWCGFTSMASVAIAAYDQTTGANITDVPSLLSPVNLSVSMAQNAYAQGKLYIVNYSETSDGFLNWTNVLVTPENYNSSFAFIKNTTTVIQKLNGSEVLRGWVNPVQRMYSKTVAVGWSNPIDLITGRLMYTKWLNNIRTNETAGYVFIWFIFGWNSPAITKALWGKKVKDKKKLKYLNLLTIMFLVMLLVVVFQLGGTQMFGMRWK